MPSPFHPARALLCALLLSTSAPAREPEHHDTFAAVQKQFASPARAFGTAPLYVWNDAMTREKIDAFMADFKDKDFGGVMVHPRPGLITEYLSEDWYSLFAYTLQKGRELDLNVWIYDENSYPSGAAGGHMTVEMPESANEGVSLRPHRFTALPDDAGKFFLILKEQNGAFADITGKLAGEKDATGVFYAFEKGFYGRTGIHGGNTYVDLLKQGVTEKFIDLTMQGYARVAGSEFGKFVPGVFQDEAEIRPPGGLRWTPTLFDTFQKTWGYDLKTALPSLVNEVGDWKKVRHNYEQTLLQLFIDNWAKPYHDYCAKRNLQFTGHYWEHSWPNPAGGPDNMAMYAWHQVPAIDLLWNLFGEARPADQFGIIRNVKELRSAANQTGAVRTLSETYGGGGWDETFRDFKRLGDWEYVLGVNFMNQHLCHTTLAGARKIDYPPSFTHHSPWWPYYGTLNRHYARLSLALSAGRQINDILVIEPTTTAWSYFSYHQSNPRLGEIGNSFQAFVTTLEKAQVEYDLGSENIIKDRGKIAGKKFVVGAASYGTVVIPPLTETLDAATFRLLKEFNRRGGKIITFALPGRLDGALNDDVQSFFSNATGILRIGELTPQLIARHLASKEIHFANIAGGNLFHHRRTLQDGNLLFLVNSSLESDTALTVEIPGKTVLELDTLTGEIFAATRQSAGGTATLELIIPPAGSRLFYTTQNNLAGFAQRPLPPQKTAPVPSAGPLEISATAPNVLTLDFCDLETKGKTWSNIHNLTAAYETFRAHGFNANPWDGAVQYKTNLLDRGNFTDGGFKASYKFTVNGAFDTAGMRAVVERAGLYNITLNGTALKPLPGEWWLDHNFGVLDIGALVRPGENVLALEISPMSLHAEIEPVYILGNFSVLPAARGFTLDAPAPLALGSWKTQGRPFYKDAVAYKKTFPVTAPAKFYEVRLPKWSGTVAEVVVNNTSAGIIAWEPCALDVSKHIKPGNNTVEVRVVGSNRNLLGPLHNSTVGISGPGHFKNVHAQPAGEKYFQLDYGLMADFALVEGRSE